MIYEENKLKEKLIKIENNNYLLEREKDYFNIGLEMLESIGSLDPILRDDLIYGTLSNWILENKFTVEQLKKLLNISLDTDHLFYKLYEKDDDAVFKRTFSVLIVALIIEKHRDEKFLCKEDLYEIKNKLIEYMNNEQDVRGYVEVKGWAHSAAHTADALAVLAQCSDINKIDLLDILNSIKAKVCIGYYVYIEEESERMVTVIENSFNRNMLSDLEINSWLHEFKLQNTKASYIENMHLKVNVKGFLRSLYFRLLEQDNFNGINEEIKKTIKSLK
ncbi:hypothetical protein CLPUN_48460 [Clostridium puniceum]|uniref:DUF2785 domain-containing protein n=1 Tax=Clostridium puniceum TaxID=29367 RepID=A0A1S8T2L6_9CLOT|nr:DUF2785 domain-containing protein [Clostridium puniceum]OOM72016.1 hypothetical protein CLPUN_48460 [Clostridium puniceum]